MTTKKIIAQLQAQGHKISYTKRKDGGVRITKIDGVSFTGSTGNRRARAMTGNALSVRQQTQLNKSYMRTPKGQFGHKKNKKPPLTDEAKKLIRKSQRVFRKEGVISGTSSTYRFRENVEQYGYEEAMRRLRQNIRYAKGLAYIENVEHLINVLRDYKDKLEFQNNEEELFNQLIMKIESMKENFKDKWIIAIRNLIYNRRDNQISTQNLIDDINEKLNE